MIKRIIPILATLILITIAGIWFSSRRYQSSIESPTIDTLIVGTNAEFQPFSFIENNQIVGFDIDVIKEAAKRLNKKLSLVNMSFSALIPELQLGNIYVIAAGMTPTEQRAKRTFFTAPHFTGDPLLAIQKNNAPEISKPSELEGKTVAVNQGYTADNYLSDLGNLSMVRLSSPLISMGLLAINSGQADVYVASKSSLMPFLEKEHKNYTISTLEGTGESSALAVSKKHPNLFAALETTLNQMRQDGTLEKLQKKWKLND